MLEILTDHERQLVSDHVEDDFIKDFRDWAGIKTDAPSYTLTAAALQTLSLAAGDTTVMPSLFGGHEYMNLFIMVVGPSTTMRKSTVLNFIRDLLPKTAVNGESYIAILDDVSIQAFNKVMADQGKNMAPILLSVDEVAGLFAQIRKKDSYLGSFDKTLMKAFDHSPVHIVRVNAKTDSYTGAFVNVFAASTPEPLAEVLGSRDVESGLLPRFIVFDARDALRGARIPLQDRMARHEEWEEKRDMLREFVGRIAAARAGGIPSGMDSDGNPLFPVKVLPIDADAFERLDQIDGLFYKEAGTDTTALGAIKGRAFAHVVKVSGLYALARDGVRAKVTMMDILRAAWLIEETSSDLLKMADDVGTNETERLINEVMELLAETTGGRVRQSVMTRRLKLDARDARDLIGTLLIRELVTVDKDEKGDYWWIRT